MIIIQGLKVMGKSKKAIRKTVETAGPSTARYPGGFFDEMTQREAMLVLGITQPKFTDKDLKSKHTKIMISNHPDRGGSIYLANKINEARDLLKDFTVKE